MESRGSGGTTHPLPGSLWALVLAGGKGVRLRPLVREVCGDDRPKQFVPLLGPRTLLGQTLDRVGRVVPAGRTVIVTVEGQARYVAQEGPEPHAPHVLVQPDDRGTAAGILWPAHWIEAHDPSAIVVVCPSDHFVSDDTAFMRHVEAVARFVSDHPEWIVLLGAQPDEPETDYGWIEPSERVGWTSQGPLYQVRRFREKPSPDAARALWAAGCLWNTFVMVARAGALVQAGRESLPSLHDRLTRLRTFMGTEHERWAIGQAYALAPTANFSQAILEGGRAALAVSKIPELTWCDLGTPERVARTMTRLGLSSGVPHPVHPVPG